MVILPMVNLLRVSVEHFYCQPKPSAQKENRERKHMQELNQQLCQVSFQSLGRKNTLAEIMYDQ
jgi:hypothetical protein